MKKNLMPDMQKVKMSDRSGAEFTMFLEVRKRAKGYVIFVADTHQLGASKLAQDAVFYIEKVCQKLHLDPKQVQFYRHIYQHNMGSVFGRFNINWENPQKPSYKFQMLTNIEELQSVNLIIATSEIVPLAELAGKKRHQAA